MNAQNETAQQHCDKQAAAIKVILAELQAKVDHYNSSIENKHWGHAGDLGYVLEELQAIKKATANW
jgi:methionyl-tRNA synthetase